ncbi:ABC transporter ATP-binding protein [Halocatena marina]|uniref:ABC transporter ATP-binding protein n=1 Tax=Halocatena marina TaxID=2934937 RepID=UPI00200FFE84|nr:ABC transporter ATP-binding protein [Halocatena marina]
MNSEPLLSVENLTTHFLTNEGSVRAVDSVSFDVAHGETVCVVGESGSGKTVTGESITKILQMPPGDIVAGTVTFDGMNLTEMSDTDLERIRGNRISHIFQNPQAGLNPVYTVGTQIGEAIRLHEDVSGDECRRRVIKLLDQVGIPDAAMRVDDYPHEFSGGMKQRVLIAMALSCNPDLLIADEPTTALDVSVEAQILELLSKLQDEFDMSVIFITHDLGVVAEIADRVVVMYAGKVMETADVFELFEDPAHPYTHALLSCLPGRGGEMRTIGGSLPDPVDPPNGCRFHPRCPHAIEDCTVGDQPDLHVVTDSDIHLTSCVYYGPEHDADELDRARESVAVQGTRDEGGTQASPDDSLDGGEAQ